MKAGRAKMSAFCSTLTASTTRPSAACKSSPSSNLPRAPGHGFPGGPPNDYITLYITTGFGRLRHLGADIDVTCAVKSLGRLDNWINKVYREILKKPRKDDNHLNSTIALYLYGRSFFLKDQPIDGSAREAMDYFLSQAKKYWLQLAYRQSQAHLAVALKRFGDQETATTIMKSIRNVPSTAKNSHVLARPRTVLVVVPGPDRDASDDGRGVR